jgi:hypothetical protein
VLRNVNTGAFEVYNITANQITGAALLGSVGLDWQLGGFAPVSTGSPGSMGTADSANAQLVQAMAGFGSGAGAPENSNPLPVGAEASQQTLLAPSQHI